MTAWRVAMVSVAVQPPASAAGQLTRTLAVSVLPARVTVKAPSDGACAVVSAAGPATPEADAA